MSSHSPNCRPGPLPIAIQRAVGGGWQRRFETMLAASAGSSHGRSLPAQAVRSPTAGADPRDDKFRASVRPGLVAA